MYISATERTFCAQFCLALFCAFAEYYIYSKTQIFYAFFGEGKNARYNGMQGIRIEIALEYEFEAKHTIKEKGFMNGKLK